MQASELKDRIGLVPILRAGLGMVDAMLELMPTAEVWHLGLFRDERTAAPGRVLQQASRSASVDLCLILDPMLATGGSATAAIEVAQALGRGDAGTNQARQSHRRAGGRCGGGEGAPGRRDLLRALDRQLNDKGYISGLGDAGDRHFGTGRRADVSRVVRGGGSVTLTRKELEAAHCWEADDEAPAGGDDRVPPPGALPPGAVARDPRLSHRLAADRAAPRRQGTASRQPAPARLRTRERRQLRHETSVRRGAGADCPSPNATRAIDHQRLWVDLLWSPTLAFNLFGDLSGDLERARPGGAHVVAACAWHRQRDPPRSLAGLLDPAYLNSLRAFDAAFVLEIRGGARGVIGVDTKYHERNKSETPKPENLRRYMAVASAPARSAPGAIDALKGARSWR